MTVWFDRVGWERTTYVWGANPFASENAEYCPCYGYIRRSTLHGVHGDKIASFRTAGEARAYAVLLWGGEP